MKSLREWKEWEILLQKYKLLVIPRNTNKLEEIKKEYKDYLDRIILTDIDEDDISSTAIRKALKDNDEELLNKYLDKAVLEDILKNHLYQS